MTINRYSCFKARVRALLKFRHGITLDDCTDDQRLGAAHAEGDTPEDFVDRIASKYDLDRVDQDPYGGCLSKRNNR